MTVEEFAINYLESKGMFEGQARAVVADFFSDPNEPMSDLRHKDMGGYEIPIRDNLCVSLDKKALDYIEAHIPDAWFRPLFLP